MIGMFCSMACLCTSMQGPFKTTAIKLEMYTSFGTCVAVTDLSFVMLSWWHMRSCLTLMALIYERAVCKFGYFPWGFSESNAFPALSLSERAFPVVCKDHLIFQGICGTRVLWLWLAAMPVWIIPGRRTIALLYGKFRDLLQSVFFKGDLCLKFIDFQWKRQCPIQEKAGM